MINWCNQNQGFMMVLLTFVYVVATVIICFFNYRTIIEQRSINRKQMRISSFLLRYDIYKQILDELHLWRFSSNDEVARISSMSERNEMFLYLATRNQNCFDLSNKARIAFNKEIADLFDAAWGIIRKEIYPVAKDIVLKSSADSAPIEIFTKIKRAMQEDPLKGTRDQLIKMEAELSLLIESEIQIVDCV